jgi:hypothetical protein
MPPFLSILVLLILVVGFGALWFFFLGVHVLGWITKKRWLKWLGGLPLGLMTALAVFAIALFGWELYASHSPKHVFAESFGFRAPAGMRFQSGYWTVFGDSGRARLDFVADTQTVQQILETGFVEITREEFRTHKEVHGNPTRFFEKTPFGKGFAHDVAYLSLEEATGRVRFEWDGID